MRRNKYLLTSYLIMRLLFSVKLTSCHFKVNYMTGPYLYDFYIKHEVMINRDNVHLKHCHN